MMPASRQMDVAKEKKEMHSVPTWTHPAPVLTPSAPLALYEATSLAPNQHSQPDRKAQTEPTFMEPESPRRTPMDPWDQPVHQQVI
ncbi:hypothetical protein NDU88_003830 [Pleurodeles waltl]|uniref:Uncharacterized protein n=1 Tax=Pleurodeles waltl TaxID=8319 RepID=A0AAV7T6A7_PLEWA|nr:hypothetical protein NDU88_003830 [Pleurodeles waltl]